LRITLVGCGALGGLLAARLLMQEENVQIFQHRGRRFDQLSQRGLQFLDASGKHHGFRPLLASSPENLLPSPLVIVAVKAHATSSVAPLIPHLLEENTTSRIMTVQNGLGNAEILAEAAGERRVVLAPCTYGAWVDAEGAVHEAGEGELVLGPLRRGEDLAPLEHLFRRAGFRTDLREDPLPPLWEKLAINAAINPLSALTKRPNGELLASGDLRELMQALLREALKVAQSEGIVLDHRACLEKCFSICEKTWANRSSMLQDVEAGRLTENDAISGQVVLRARRGGLSVPHTESIWRLLRGIETLREN